MPYDFKPLKEQIDGTKEWLKKEYTGVRTGQATPALLDGVSVDSYGVLTPLNQVAQVSIEDARTLRITPYDVSQVQAIEKAITDTNLGVSVAVDDKGVRTSFPELTSERRGILIKLTKDKLEEARISLRSERDKTWDDLQKKEKEKEISADEKFSYKTDMQKLIDEAGAELEGIFNRKEKEISS